MLAIRLPPPEIEERLEKLARKSGRTKTYHAREAILKYLDDLEESHLAERRYAAYLASKSRSAPLEDVERAIGLAD